MSELFGNFMGLPLVSDKLGAVGLIVTIIGFILTIRSVIKSKKAAELAGQRVEEFRKKLTVIDISSDVSSAIEMIEQVKRLQRVKSWPGVLDQYSQLRRKLVTIKSTSGTLSELQQIQLQTAIQLTARIEEQLDEMLFGQGDEVNVATLNKAISRQLQGLSDIAASLRKN